MKTILRKVILVLSLVLGFQTNVKAIKVYIPDPNFRAWLVQNYPFCMSGDSLNSNCTTILSVKRIDVTGLGITDLTGIELFINDTALFCYGNQLTSLPTLPAALKVLYCESNRLTSLPTLPASLVTLDCFNNQIDSLTTLPSSLTYLNCNSNPLSGTLVFPSSITYLDISYSKITSLPTLPTSLLDLRCHYSQLTSLPSLPGSLKNLTCDHNQLTVLPILPAGLKSLYCNNNQLTSLPPLSSTIEDIYCSYNQLTSLPTLPTALNDLECKHNQLTSLPALPSLLRTFKCTYNQLTSLPALPSLLEWFECDTNQLSSLPTLSTNLRYLICNKNQLTSLPTLPTLLFSGLYCDDNLLTSLPALPSGIGSLHCRNNQLTSLPGLPYNLSNIYCENNQLTSLPTLPGNLKNFNCSNNLITIMPAFPASNVNTININCSRNRLTVLPAIPSALRYLDCSYNQLDSIPQLNHVFELNCSYNKLKRFPNIPNSIRELNCSNNVLRDLPPLDNAIFLTKLDCNNNLLRGLSALPASLVRLQCANNQLTSLPELPSKIVTLNCNYNDITSLPENIPFSLKYLNCTDNPLSCLPKLTGVRELYFKNTLVKCIPNYGSIVKSNPLVTTIPICDPSNNINGCKFISDIEGFIYIDDDTNCIKSPTERVNSFKTVSLYRSGYFQQLTAADRYGYYYFETYAQGDYKIQPSNSVLYSTVCPVAGYYEDTISGVDTIKYNRDFAMKCNGGDLGVWSISSFNLRPASLRTVAISAGDAPVNGGIKCAPIDTGVVTISISGPASFVSPAPYALAPTSVAGNVLTYNISDFSALSFDSTFDFILRVDSSALIGSNVCITVDLSTTNQEANYGNNQLVKCYSVNPILTPNEVTVYPTKTLDINGDKWLSYTIDFQNTTNQEAKNLTITEELSEHLDFSSFELLGFSHDPSFHLFKDGLLKVDFKNINLPSSNTNEAGSRGYVQFKIKAKENLTEGTIIENTANINFNTEELVETNTVTNTIINCSLPPTIIKAIICKGEAYKLNKQSYYYTGVYRQNILTAFGCDSLIELRLTVNTINNTITQSASTLKTAAAAKNYQWINCTTGTAIVGANTQTYIPTQSGNYAVIVDFGTCVDTSNCYYFSPVGINEINASNISIQPNPFNNELKITLDKNYTGVLEVYNAIGEIITSEKLQSKYVTLNTSNWNAGVYILKVATNDGVVVKKVVKR